MDLYIDNTTATNLRQLDNRRIFRADGGYPVKSSGGGGIDVVWRNTVLTVAVGSGVTPQDKIDIVSGVWSEAIETGLSAKNLIRLQSAALVGKLSVSGDTVTIRDVNDTTDRIIATTDVAGQRTAITTNVS